jgi:hypothetical protein
MLDIGAGYGAATLEAEYANGFGEAAERLFS